MITAARYIGGLKLVVHPVAMPEKVARLPGARCRRLAVGPARRSGTGWRHPAALPGIVSDNGTELTAMAILRWCQETGAAWHYFAPRVSDYAYVMEHGRFSGAGADVAHVEKIYMGVPRGRGGPGRAQMAPG